MRIKMLTLQAGPAGVRQIGAVCDVPTAEAEDLIAGGYAVKVEKEETEVAPAVPVEETVIETAAREEKILARKAVKSK